MQDYAYIYTIHNYRACLKQDFVFSVDIDVEFHFAREALSKGYT